MFLYINKNVIFSLGKLSNFRQLVQTFPKDLKLLQTIVTSGVIVTTATIGSFVPKVQAATFTLPIEAAAEATGVDVLRDRYGLDGNGVTIGVLSDSFATAETFDATGNLDTYATNIANGYLPSNVNVLRDYASSDTTDEGRALLQIIHAVAPGANLIFHTSLSSTDAFGQGIQALAAAGADIIVDDWGYGYPPNAPPNTPLDLLDLEPPNGPINQAINAVVNQGISYFASADNNYLPPDSGVSGIPTYGHVNNPNALTVGAVYYGNAESYSNHTFDVVVNQGQLEPFSSEGAPGSLKPDVVAPDGLPISFNLGGGSPSDADPRFFSFIGTSASAPFTAAVAALLLQADPSATPTEIYNALRNTADSPLPGFDSRLGFGLIQADKAVQAIPEPSSLWGTLAFGALGAGWMLKRQLKEAKMIKRG